MDSAGATGPAGASEAPALDRLRLDIEQAALAPGGGITVTGWAVSLAEIGRIAVRLGEHDLGVAEAGQFRQDLLVRCAGYPNVLRSGFTLELPAAPAAAAAGQPVVVTVTDVDGCSRTATLALHPSAHRRPPGAAVLSDVVAPLSALPPGASSVLLAMLDEVRITDRGVLRVRGWAVGLSPIEQITVHLDDRALGAAEQALKRPDVALEHPAYPDAGLSGFQFQHALSDDEIATAATRTLRVVVLAAGGVRRELKARLPQVAAIARPKRDTSVHFHCDEITLDDAGSLLVKGWAVCPSGIEALDFTVGVVDAGSSVPQEERPDVGNRFADIASARRSGFRHTRMLSQRFEGEQVIRIVVRGKAGEERVLVYSVLASPATLSADAAAPGGDPDRIRFFLEAPAVQDGLATETVRGFLSLNGWAFSRPGIATIAVFANGLLLGNAYHGIRREDLDRAFPQANALLSGFAQMVPPQALRQGANEIRVVITDKAGTTEETSFTVEAEPSAEGPGPWQLRHKLTEAEVGLQLALLAGVAYRPRYRLLLPLDRVAAPDLLRAGATIASLRHQAYDDWRLTVALPPGTNAAAVAEALLASCDDLAPRIDVACHDGATLLADLSHDDALLVMVAPGDTLGEDALLEFSLEAAVLGQTPAGRPDFLYSDERRIDPADGAAKAFFKPDWSPDLLLSTNYIGRLWVATPALLRRAGLTLSDLTRRGDYDAVLRLAEHAGRIGHVSRVLWARGDGGQDSPALERRALRTALARRGIAGTVAQGCLPGSWRCRRDVVVTGKVSIIIPTIASRGLVRITIESIRAHTAWPDYEIIVLDNIQAGDDPEKLRWKQWLRANADTVVEIRERFNWSRFNNRGARKARGDFLLFLNDDMEILDDGWLHGLMEHAQRPEVGIAGPQLLYPDGRVQHAGVFLSREVGRHAFRFYPRDAPGPFGLARSQRNVISVTGACMLMRRAVFDTLGGFDEAHAVVNNDLDFALRAHQAGLLTVYTPHVTLIHHEMVSRYTLKDTYNSKHFDAVWKDRFLQGDPYFNTHLTSDYDDYPLEVEPLRRLQVGHPIIAHDKVRRILAVKVDHIGDFIAAFPSFRRLKQHFPHAELTVLAAKASLSLAQMEPSIDRVIEYNFFHARSERGHRAAARRELAELSATLAPYRFDLAVDLRRQSDTRPLLKVSGARWLAGFEQRGDMKWLDIAVEWEGDFARSAKRTHVTDSLVQFIDAVAVACGTDRSVVHNPQLAVDARRMLAALPAVRPMADALFARRVVCVHTGAGAVNKQWPAASFASLIDLLVGQEDVNVMVIGGPDEALFAGEVLAQLRRPERVFSLVAKTGLRDLPTALLSASLYIGNDSGPKHMAASLGVPTIGIHSGTVDAGEWGPMGVHALTIRRDMTCSPCYLARASDCHRGLACLHGIKVGDIYRACQRMLLLNPAAAIRESEQA